MYKYVYGGLVFFLILNVNNIKGLANVSSCPLESSKWIQRESLKSCDEGEGLLYHCMKSSWDTFVEFCMVPVSIKVYDGCPRIQASGNLKVRYVKCLISENCQNKINATYLSYQIYEYYGCYQEEIHTTRITTERTSTTKHSPKFSTTVDPHTVVVYTTSNGTGKGNDEITRVINSKSPSTQSISLQFTSLLVTALGIIVLLLLVSITTLIYYIVKTRIETNGVYWQNINCSANRNISRQEDNAYNEIESILSET